MSFDYAEIAEAAKELITEFGLACTLTKKTAGTNDGVTGTITGATTTTHTVNAVVDNYANSLLDGTLIKRGDKLLYIESDVQPLIGNTISIGSVAHKVINVETIAPGGTVVLYQAQVRV
jgi:hypothetical protein